MTNTELKMSNRGAADTSLAQGGVPHICCGGPARSGASACCALDAEVKSTGGTGCGCGSAAVTPVPKTSVCCG